MANPTGKSGPRDKPFREALRLSVNEAIEGDDFKKLRRIADKLVACALDGEVQAIKEIADRLDGKVPQAIGGSEELPSISIDKIERVIVRHTPDRDSADI